MKPIIIVSKKDTAGMNIKDQLIENHGFKRAMEQFENNQIFEKAIGNQKIKLVTATRDSIYLQDIDKLFNADLFIFATKHASKSGIPSLSIHSPGNFGKAELGGKEKKLCVCPAKYLRKGMILMNHYNGERKLHWDVIQEATHHGPYLEKPTFFIEIGSKESEWKNKNAGEIIAQVIVDLIEEEPDERKTYFGIGGQHTCTNFKKVLSKDIAIGHVCPKYNLENLDEEMIKQGIAMHTEKEVGVMLDWKGLGTHKKDVKKILERANIPFVRLDQLP